MFFKTSSYAVQVCFKCRQFIDWQVEHYLKEWTEWGTQRHPTETHLGKCVYSETIYRQYWCKSCVFKYHDKKELTDLRYKQT